MAGCRPKIFVCCCRFANIQKEKRELEDRLVDYALQAMDGSSDVAFAKSARAANQGGSARSIAGVGKQLQKSQEAEAVIAEVRVVTIQHLNVNVCGSEHSPAVVQHDFGTLATSIGRRQLQATYSKLQDSGLVLQGTRLECQFSSLSEARHLSWCSAINLSRGGHPLPDRWGCCTIVIDALSAL